MSKVRLITGAGRGLGVDIANAALAAGHNVVATGRNSGRVARALGKTADLSVVKLDITKPSDAESAVKAGSGSGDSRFAIRLKRKGSSRADSAVMCRKRCTPQNVV